MAKLEEFAITAELKLSYRMIVRASTLDNAQAIAADVAADFVANSSETRSVQWETPLEPDPRGAWEDGSIAFRVEETIDGDYVVLPDPSDESPGPVGDPGFEDAYESGLGEPSLEYEDRVTGWREEPGDDLLALRQEFDEHELDV